MAGQIHVGTCWPESGGNGLGRKSLRASPPSAKVLYLPQGGGETLAGWSEPSLQEGWKDPSIPRKELKPPAVLGLACDDARGRRGSAFPWAEAAFHIHMGL